MDNKQAVEILRQKKAEAMEKVYEPGKYGLTLREYEAEEAFAEACVMAIFAIEQKDRAERQKPGDISSLLDKVDWREGVLMVASALLASVMVTLLK